MRRGSASIAANPVLIGAATTLVVIVAVFLAYNANSGLPFVPTYELKAEVPNAANLVKGNDVRIGGTRVGVGDATSRPVTRQGRLGHRRSSTLKLETTVKPLPVDSTVLIRPRSALGLKYVEITRGHVEPRASRTARRSRCATHGRSRSSSTRSSTRSTTKTRAALAEQPDRVRQRASPAAAPTSTRRSRSSTRC